MIGCRKLANYCFIIHLDGCLCSFYCGNNFMMIMTSSMNLVNKKVVDNLLIYLVLNFHSRRAYGLRIMAVVRVVDNLQSLVSEMLALWIDLND